MEGKIVVFEGLDGGGKSTLVRAVAAEVARTRTVETFSYPNASTPIGSVVRRSFDGEVKLHPSSYQYLLLAEGLDHWPKLMEWKAAGSIVLIDRHTRFGSQVYGPETHGLAFMQGLYRPHAGTFDAHFSHVFVVDVPGEVALSRISGRGGADKVFEAGSVRKYERRRERYLELAAETGAEILDGRRPTAELAAYVVGRIL